MTRAIELARRAEAAGEVPVGAVIVGDGVLVAEGWNHPIGANDPMCASAMVHARVQRLVYAATDPRAGAAGSVFNIVQHPQLNHRLECTGGEPMPATARMLRHASWTTACCATTKATR